MELEFISGRKWCEYADKLSAGPQCSQTIAFQSSNHCDLPKKALGPALTVNFRQWTSSFLKKTLMYQRMDPRCVRNVPSSVSRADLSQQDSWTWGWWEKVPESLVLAMKQAHCWKQIHDEQVEQADVKKLGVKVMKSNILHLICIKVRSLVTASP